MEVRARSGTGCGTGVGRGVDGVGTDVLRECGGGIGEEVEVDLVKQDPFCLIADFGGLAPPEEHGQQHLSSANPGFPMHRFCHVELGIENISDACFS